MRCPPCFLVTLHLGVIGILYSVIVGLLGRLYCHYIETYLKNSDIQGFPSVSNTLRTVIYYIILYYIILYYIILYYIILYYIILYYIILYYIILYYIILYYIILYYIILYYIILYYIILYYIQAS